MITAAARAGIWIVPVGGRDGGDPAQDTDPGLGTWQEFHDAIAQAANDVRAV